MELGYRLRELREDSDLSQAALAEALGMHKTTYARYEQGCRDLPLQIAIRLADYYHISLDELAGRKPSAHGMERGTAWNCKPNA